MSARTLGYSLALCTGAALCVFAPGSARAAAAETTVDHVLIVANNNSLDNGVKPLRFADDDGARYYELFSRVSPNVSLLAVLDSDTARTHKRAASAARVPWARELRAAISRIRAAVERDNNAGRRTRFVFVYVGHGNVDKAGQGYINLQDVKLRRRDLFQQIIERVPANTVHLIIDACKSYFLVSRGPTSAPTSAPTGWRDDRSGRSYGAAVRAFLARRTLESHPHVGVIVSTSGNEDVHEWSEFRSGVFSHQLRSALSGAADLNGDGKIEYSEIGAFIAAANRRVSYQAARLRPFLRAPPSARHATLMTLPSSARAPMLELGAAQGGRFVVEDERGVRTVDLNKARGSTVRIALAPRRAYYIRHGEREYRFSARGRGLVKLARLSFGPRRARPRGALEQSYRSGLFAVSLSRAFYEGYLAFSGLPSVRFEGVERRYEPEQPGALSLSFGYTLSSAPLRLDHMPAGLSHGFAAGGRYLLGEAQRLFVTARVELGVSRHDLGDSGYDLLRFAALGGFGAVVRPLWWLELAAEVDVGWQGIVARGQGTRDLTGMRFGGQLELIVRPSRRLPNLGISVRGGLYGNLVSELSDPPEQGGERVTREKVYATPELGVGLRYAF
ncbi:MAG: hypothetical protein KC503_16610 [Myxococcales bacterium]|nr:hypothetical protein [Myxococcales bacterium]